MFVVSKLYLNDKLNIRTQIDKMGLHMVREKGERELLYSFVCTLWGENRSKKYLLHTRSTWWSLKKRAVYVHLCWLREWFHPSINFVALPIRNFVATQ